MGSKTGVTCWEPFGARFCNLVASRPAIKGAFWDYWETAVLGQILAGSPLEPDFGSFEASRPAIKSAFWDYWETAVFEPNPGREPFGARFWQFAGFPAASRRTFWGYWETAVLGQILAGSPLEPDFGNLAASGSLWEASGKPLANSQETAVPLGQARGGQRTPRHKRFSRKDFPSRTLRAGSRFCSLGALFCVFEASNVVLAA